jgi:hypothetical protein
MQRSSASTAWRRTAGPDPLLQHGLWLQNYGIDLAVEMCKELLAAGTPGLHMYTLNLERRCAHGLLGGWQPGTGESGPVPCQRTCCCPSHPCSTSRLPPCSQPRPWVGGCSAVAILERLGVLDPANVPRPLPWRHIPHTSRRQEEVSAFEGGSACFCVCVRGGGGGRGVHGRRSY